VLKSEYYYTPAITLVVRRKSGTETQLFHNEDLALPELACLLITY
jgi:hypothetical protein